MPRPGRSWARSWSLPSGSDEALAAKVQAAIEQNPYIFSDHITVTAKNGVVTVRGVVNDLNDLLAILRIARRVAGKGRVVNEIEFQAVDDAGNIT